MGKYQGAAQTLELNCNSDEVMPECQSFPGVRGAHTSDANAPFIIDNLLTEDLTEPTQMKN